MNVAEVMEKKLLTVQPSTTLETDRDKATLLLKVGATMSKRIISTKSTEPLHHGNARKDYQCFPVVDEENKAVRIIISTDLLKGLVSKLP